MMIRELSLVWGTPGDVRLKSDGGEYASTFVLTPQGIAKVAQALGVREFRYADFCDCEVKREGDGIHVPDEPSDTICLASPIVRESGDSEEER